MTTNNNINENMTEDNRNNSSPNSNNNNIFSSYVNKNKSKLSHIKNMASTFIEKNFFYNNNNMYKGYTTPSKNNNKINSSKNDDQTENAIDSEQDQDSNINRRSINHENKENEENSDNNFSSKESNTTNLSIDSSCSIEMDYKNDKEVLRNLEKDLNYDKGKGIPKFLKNPAKKRMNKLKKIIEILEYSIYNEERKGNKLEKKLYQYVLLTRNLKKEIYNLELTNNNSKNKITTYEKDIIKLKEQNEEMKLTLSTFENELSNLINKFDKNFAKELIDTKSKNDILKKEVERLKKEIELKNSEIKKIESYNDITKKNTSDSAAVPQSDNMNSEPVTDPVSSTSNISNSFITSNPTNSSIPSNSTNIIGFENNTEPAIPRNNNNFSNTTNAHNNSTNTSNLPNATISHEFPFYYGSSEEVPQNNVDEFIAKIKNNRIIFDKNIDKYDEETKSAIYGCHISNIILENPDICNHKKVLKILQDHCVSESRLLNIHISLKRERCDNYVSQKELEKEVIRQIENMNFDKNKDKNISIINSIVLTLILKNVHIFNLYKIFILSLKYDNFRWVKIIKKSLFLKFFDLSLIDFEIKINEPSKLKETKLIHILGGTNAVLSNENNVEIEVNQNIQYNIKHPLFYCPNELLKRLMYEMYLNFTKEPINPQNNDNIYHYILQKKNYDLLKLLKLSGKNINFIFNKNSDNKTPLDYVENEDVHIDLISGYILDIAGKGAENYKNYRYEQAYQLYSEALEKQIKLSNSIKLGSSKSMSENIGKLYYNRARTLMHLNKWIDAIDNCNNCLKYIPKYINAYDTQIHAYEYLLEYDNALSTYKTMCVKCNIKPDDKEDKLKAQMNATAFQILNINKNSTVIEIKQAFSNLSKKWHPDKLGINTSEDIKKRHNNHFKKLFKAKQLLLNDLERYKEKKKKETNFVYPQIIDDSSLAHRNESNNNNNNAESQDKKSNLIPSNDSSYDQTKENKKTSDIYETSAPDSNNGLNKNGNPANLFNSYKDDIEKFQEKLKNLNKGINNNDNDVSKNINPFNNVFDNKGTNEKVDENFYKKLKEEYEGLNDDQLNNFKTKISNSINNLIQTEINLKREYQELCNKEKNNAIMNARLCILQEIQKALCVRLDKERRLKIIETVLKDKSSNNTSTSMPTNNKEDEKVNGYPHPSKANKQNTSTEEEISGDVPNEKNRNSNNVEYSSTEENIFKSNQEYSEQNQPNNNVETGSKTEKGKNENQSFDENEQDEIEEGYHSRGKYYEYYYDDKNNRYIKEQNDEDFINDTSYDHKKYHEEIQQGKNYYDSKSYENVNTNYDDNLNNEKGGTKKNDQHNIREEDTDNIEKRNIQEVSNSNKISDSNGSSNNINSQTNSQTNSGMNDNGHGDNPDDSGGSNRKRNSKDNLNKGWKNEQINESNQIPNEHTNFLFMSEEHKNKDVYNNHFDNMTNIKQGSQAYRNSNNIYDYMSSANNQYSKSQAINSSQTNTEVKSESYPFGSKIHINNNDTFYEDKENANIETNGYVNKYHAKERVTSSDASNNEKAEQDVTNQPVGEQDSGEKKYTNFNKNNQTNEENVNDSTNNYYDKDSVYLMYNSRNSNLLDKMGKKKNENSINKTDSVEESDKERETYYNEDNEINKLNFKNKNDEYITSQMMGSNNNFLKKISSNNSTRNIHTINSERLIQKKATYPNDNTIKKQTIEKRNSQKVSGNMYSNNSDTEQDQDQYNGETKQYDSSFYGKSYVSTNKSVSNIKNSLDKKIPKNFDSSEDFSNYNENNNFYNIHNDEYKTYHFSNEQPDQDIN